MKGYIALNQSQIKNQKSSYNAKRRLRTLTRLKWYDYSSAGSYFITIKCHNRIHRFGHVKDGKMILNPLGEIAHNEWNNLSTRFQHISMDVVQIMPDHMHGILSIRDIETVGARLTLAPIEIDSNCAKCSGATARVAPTVSHIIGAYKSIVSNACLKIFKSKNERMGKLWQSNFYDHVIRNQKAYDNIFSYIQRNPKQWSINRDKRR